MEIYETPANLRDLGGLPAGTGARIRPGRLIRSGALCGMSAETIRSLGHILAVFDLRSENERRFYPDPSIGGSIYRHIAVTESGRRELINSKRTLEDKVADILSGYGRGEPPASFRMVTVYRRMVLSPEMGGCLEQIIRMLAGHPQGAVLWHCAAGKDRTGVVAALLLKLLGVPDEAVYADYLYTNLALRHELEQVKHMVQSVTQDPAALHYTKGFFAACPCWLAAALSAVESKFGSAESYIYRHTAITPKELAQFRENCLENEAKSGASLPFKNIYDAARPFEHANAYSFSAAYTGLFNEPQRAD